MYTINCIVCHKPANIWTGHVLYGSRRVPVTAGWCKEHLCKSGDLSLMKEGSFGEWKPEYGKESDFENLKPSTNANN